MIFIDTFCVECLFPHSDRRHIDLEQIVPTSKNDVSGKSVTFQQFLPVCSKLYLQDYCSGLHFLSTMI